MGVLIGDLMAGADERFGFGGERKKSGKRSGRYGVAGDMGAAGEYRGPSARKERGLQDDKNARERGLQGDKNARECGLQDDKNARERGLQDDKNARERGL